MRKVIAIFCMCAVGFLVSCGEKNPTGTGDGGGGNTITYSVSGNTITTFFPATISTYCDSINILRYDTTDADSDTATFVILNNNNLMVVTHSDGDVDSLTRVGSGTGIQGTWTDSSGMTIVVGASTITMTLNFADMMEEVLQLLSKFSDVTVAKTSANSITITGNITKEVVTVTANSNGDATYSSSDPLHASAVEYANPSTCPNDGPAWLTDFFKDNPSDLGKMSASRTTHFFLTSLTKKPVFRW